MLSVLASSQRQQRTHIRHVLQPFQHRDQVQEVIIRRVVDPALDWDRVVCRVVREICSLGAQRGKRAPTLVKHVAQRTVIQNQDLAQVRLHRAQVLDECPVPERAVLPVVPSAEELPFRLKPVDHRVGVLLHAGGEDDQVVPLAYLLSG